MKNSNYDLNTCKEITRKLYMTKPLCIEMMRHVWKR